MSSAPAMRRPDETGVPDPFPYMHPVMKKNYGAWAWHDRPRPGVLHHVAKSGDQIWTVRAGILRDESPSWWPGSGGGEVWHQAKVALANGIVAVPAIWLLDKTRPLWGFSTAKRVVPGAAREVV